MNIDQTEPHYVLSLTDGNSGTILCQIEECKKRKFSLNITRSNKRPWSSQNFYRHVRAAHFTPDAKKAKTTDETSDTPLDFSDEDAEGDQTKSKS